MTHYQRGPNARVVLVVWTILAIFVMVALRVGQLTVVQGEDLRRKADLQYRKILRLAGTRGAILARDRKTLAGTVATPSVYGSPRYHSLSGEQIQSLAAALQLPPDSLGARLASNRGFVWITRWVTREQAQLIERLALPGVGVIHEGRRKYPNGGLASHVIGTAGTSLQGLEGIELLYDQFMRGEDKVLSLERDGRGRTLLVEGATSAPLEPAERPAPAPRATLELTIDARIQSVAERELAKGVIDADADAGTAIVLDPWTGAVLALANVPSYDPNRPGQVGPDERRNRAISDVFEPGSTFKAFTVAAALEEGLLSPEEMIDCENGSRRVGGWTINDHHRYGLLSVPEVIQFSSNIGASKIAARLGAERFARYVGAFGFGRKTAIDLPGEVPGIVRAPGRWAPIDVATGSFGQGIAVTPIQLAAAFGAIANGGRLYQPFVLSRAVDGKGRALFDWDVAEQEAASQHSISEPTARSVTAMLERVVAEARGTGTRARIEGVRVAGKTGTAQKVDPKTGRYSHQRLASFIGFAPAEAPAVVTVVMIDNPRRATYGGVVAAPVFAAITERALDQLGRRPPRVVVRSEGIAARPKPLRPPELVVLDGVPSFVGMSLRLALDTARADGFAVDIRGSGWVVAQEPAAGAPRDGRRILLLLESHA